MLHAGATSMETFEPDAPIFLVGFMATGKTTVGRILAARLGWKLVDLDEVIVRDAGQTVSRIFETEGEAGFRAREASALGAVSRERALVVATGGGAACREDNLRAMLGAGRVVALAITPEEAVRRARGGAGRPLLSGPDPIATATALLAARAPYYARAHLSVETVGRLPQDVARDVLAWMQGGAS
jgi:shikimate kinase / 3-dehydroquinate synthase